MCVEDAKPDFEYQYQRPEIKYELLLEAEYGHQDKSERLEDEVSSAEDDEDSITMPCPQCYKTQLVKHKPWRSSDPVVPNGTMASTDRVMRHGPIGDSIWKQYSVPCFKMEEAGLMNDFPCLVVGGIFDPEYYLKSAYGQIGAICL